MARTPWKARVIAHFYLPHPALTPLWSERRRLRELKALQRKPLPSPQATSGGASWTRGQQCDHDVIRLGIAVGDAWSSS